MKKALIYLFVLCSMVVFFSFGAASAEGIKGDSESTFFFPASLQEIEKEAFSGTAVETVVFQYGFLSIGEDAFSDTDCLRDVFLPPSTEHIADSAFPSNSKLVIHGVEGSAAQEWAEEHRVTFVAEDIWMLMPDTGEKISGHENENCFIDSAVDPNQTVSRATDKNESKRPQDRPELNPIDYRFP